MCTSQSYCGTKKLLLVVLAVGVTTVSVMVVVVVVGGGGGGGGGGDNTEVIRMELPWRGRCMKQGVWGSIHGILWYCTVCDWFGEQFSQNNCETPD